MKVTVNTQAGSRASINNQQRATVRAMGVNSALNYLSQLDDVDVSDAQDGESLVYDGVEEKFVIKSIPRINGGTF